MLGYGDSPESTASPVILGQSPKGFQGMDEERFIGRTIKLYFILLFPIIRFSV